MFMLYVRKLRHGEKEKNKSCKRLNLNANILFKTFVKNKTI